MLGTVSTREEEAMKIGLRVFNFTAGLVEAVEAGRYSDSEAQLEKVRAFELLVLSKVIRDS